MFELVCSDLHGSWLEGDCGVDVRVTGDGRFARGHFKCLGDRLELAAGERLDANQNIAGNLYKGGYPGQEMERKRA